MTDAAQSSIAQQMLGDFASKLVALTDDIPVRRRAGTHRIVPARPQSGHHHRPDRRRQHRAVATHLQLGRDNGLTQTEIVELITHAAFYCGWPKAMSAIMAAKKVFEG